MTSSKQLKLRIRARMAKTGERYTTARMHVLGSTATPGPTMIDDHGYPLGGGSAAEVAAVANVLTHGDMTRHDGRPLSEAIIFAASGGIGAGYILWEFSHDYGRHLVLGFRSRWQYPQAWITTTLERLHVPYQIHTTGGAKGAASRLTTELSAGRPVLVLPDRYLLGYWHLPAHLEAFGGHFVVAYAEADGRVHVDDRNLSPLTVSRQAFDAARQRVVSYKNLLVSPRPKAGPVADDLLVDAVSAGLRDCAERLSATSDSFSIPAWRKWGRLMTDPKNAKGWPTVFADRRGLVGALLSIWEGSSALGMTGGTLRPLFADSLDEAAGLLDRPALAEQATAWREIGRQWHELADVVLPTSRPEFARLRELTAEVQEGIVAHGDTGQAAVTRAADELWRLREQHDRDVPLEADDVGDLFADIGNRLGAIHAAERIAIDDLAATMT